MKKTCTKRCPYSYILHLIALLICGAFVTHAYGQTMATLPAAKARSDSAYQFTPLCEVTYTISSQWHNGFNAHVSIVNHGDRISGWELEWVFDGDQSITNMWDAMPLQNGAHISARDAGYNAVIDHGRSVSFGFQASYSGDNTVPTTFWLNGNQCNQPGEPTPTVVPTPTIAGFACAVDYVIRSEWNNGFVADVIIRNDGPQITGWRLNWVFTGDQQIINAWNAVVSQNGTNVSMADAGYNTTIASGESVTVGFQASYSSMNPIPSQFVLNDVLCQGNGGSMPTPTSMPTGTPLPTATPLPCPPVAIDGDFLDWVCQPFVSDPPDDCGIKRLDLLTFAFVTNPDNPTAYFMAESSADNGTLYLILRVDTNNNGVYDDPADRIVRVEYKTRPRASQVTVTLFDGTDTYLETIGENEDWGASKNEGGRQVEWAVTFAQLGIPAGQPIRLILASHPGGGNAPVCDITDEVQWSPATALGFAIICILLILAAVDMARRRRLQ